MSAIYLKGHVGFYTRTYKNDIQHWFTDIQVFINSLYNFKTNYDKAKDTLQY